MEKMLELERNVVIIKTIMSDINLIQAIPKDQLTNGYMRLTEVQKGLIDAVFRTQDHIGFLQWLINHAGGEETIIQKTVNSKGEKYTMEERLEISLRALADVSDPELVDIVKTHIRAYVDELRSKIIALQFPSNYSVT